MRLSILVLLSQVALVAAAAGDPPPNRVTIDHEYVDQWDSGEFVVHDVNLVVKAIGPGLAGDIRLVNVDMEGGSVDTAEHYIGDLVSEAVARSPLRLSYLSGREPPELFWRVEYTDANGQRHSKVLGAD